MPRMLAARTAMAAVSIAMATRISPKAGARTAMASTMTRMAAANVAMAAWTIGLIHVAIGLIRVATRPVAPAVRLFRIARRLIRVATRPVAPAVRLFRIARRLIRVATRVFDPDARPARVAIRAFDAATRLLAAAIRLLTQVGRVVPAAIAMFTSAGRTAGQDAFAAPRLSVRPRRARISTLQPQLIARVDVALVRRHAGRDEWLRRDAHLNGTEVRDTALPAPVELQTLLRSVAPSAHARDCWPGVHDSSVLDAQNGIVRREGRVADRLSRSGVAGYALKRSGAQAPAATGDRGLGA
jgi:hypothetical protein